MSRRNDPLGFGFEGVDRDDLLPCFECGVKTKGRHHVVPVNAGGGKVLPLCHDCHNIAHGCLILPDAIKNGLEKARSKGVKLGAPIKVDETIATRAKEFRQRGYSYRKISKLLNISVGSVCKACKLA